MNGTEQKTQTQPLFNFDKDTKSIIESLSNNKKNGHQLKYSPFFYKFKCKVKAVKLLGKK